MEDSRCWIFGSSRPLSPQDPQVGERLSRFLTQWQSHGEPVTGAWKVLEERFLVITLTGDETAVSGCSMDAMKAEIQGLEKALDTQFLDSSRLFFRGEDGAVHCATRAEFKRLAAEGRISPDTEVFDPTITQAGDLRSGVFSKALRDSWHLRLYQNARPAS